jgi:hypothetical protein
MQMEHFPNGGNVRHVCPQSESSQSKRFGKKSNLLAILNHGRLDSWNERVLVNMKMSFHAAANLQ